MTRGLRRLVVTLLACTAFVLLALLRIVVGLALIALLVLGGLLVLTGIAFLTGFVTTASFWLLEMFPVLGTIG